MEIFPVDPPFALQVEPTEGCSLACAFCGIASIRENGACAETMEHGKNSAPYRFMEVDTVKRLAKEVRRLKWNPRWEFAMHGDPTMNPHLHEMIAVTRRILPKAHLQVTTNGSALMTNEKIQALFDAGLNLLALDDYKHAKFIPRIRTIFQEGPITSKHGDVPVYEYPEQKEGNPHKRQVKPRISIIHDISENDSGNHQLTNQGGNSLAALKEPLKRRCAKPFREFSVRWDGNVALCCDDWKGEYKIGNVLELGLDEIWMHPRFEAARRRLYHRDRNFGPCTGCNVLTKRDGLLPDKLGKGNMRKPTEVSEKHIQRALRGRVFTIKLLKNGEPA